MPLSSEEIDTISAVSVAVSVLSVIGSSFIIASYLYYKHLRKFAFKLVFILSVNDFFNQIGDFLLPSPRDLKEQEVSDDPSALCLAQSYTESFFELSSVMWTTAIAATLYMTVFLGIKNPETKMPYFYGVCFGLPLLLTVVCGAVGAYGPAGAWCWITEDYDYLRFVQFFIPLWIAIAFNAVVYIRVIRMISSTFKATGGDQGTAQTMKQIINKLRFYPLILIIVWLFATINRTVEAANNNDQIFWLYTLQKFFSSMQGFLNAFAYGFSGGVREALRGTFAKYFKCMDATPTVADQLMGGVGAAPLPVMSPGAGGGGGQPGQANDTTAGITLELSGAGAGLHTAPAGSGVGSADANRGTRVHTLRGAGSGPDEL